MKDEGLVRAVGISGYPLPVLLRLALLVLHNPPYRPLDAILSYSHYTLQNNIFSAFAPVFRTRANVSQLTTASPLSMGLLKSDVPDWHPAPPELLAAKNKAVDYCISHGWQGGLPNLALGFSARRDIPDLMDVPLVVGLSTLAEIHESMKVWWDANCGQEQVIQKRKQHEEAVRHIFQVAGWQGWSWPSPPSCSQGS